MICGIVPILSKFGFSYFPQAKKVRLLNYFVYLRTTCRSLNVPQFHVLTRVVRVQFFLLDEAVVLRKVILAFSGLIVICKISAIRPQEYLQTHAKLHSFNNTSSGD